MTPIAHGVAAWLIAILLLKKPEDRAVVVVAGCAPDIDGIFVLWDLGEFVRWHHTFGHSLIFGALLALAVLPFAKSRMMTAFAVFLGIAAHLAADIVATNWAVNPFYPYGGVWLSIGDYLPSSIIYLFVANGIYALLFLGMLLAIYVKEASPFEIVSKKLDAAWVDAVVLPFKHRCGCGKRASLRCQSCGAVVCNEHSGDAWKRTCGKCGSAVNDTPSPPQPI